MPMKSCLLAKYRCFKVDWKLFWILKWAQNWAALKTFWARAQGLEKIERKRERKHILQLSASAAKFFERTKALDLSPNLNMNKFWCWLVDD